MHDGEIPQPAGHRKALERPPQAVLELLRRIGLGQPLDPGLIGRSFEELPRVSDSGLRDSLLAAVLTGLMARGPREDEVVETLAAAMSLDRVAPVALPERLRRTVIVAGSGKKGFRSFNVSTIAAIVAAAAGASVVKIGSRATSSLMGSRDLACALGLAECDTPTEIVQALDRARFAFVPIEERIPLLDDLYGGRFHVLNPLSFGLAALAPGLRGGVFVFGVSHPRVDLAASVLKHFGVRDAVVVASHDGQGRYADEFGLGEQSLLCTLQDGTRGPVETHDREALRDLGIEPPGETTPAPASRGEAMRLALDALSGRGPAHNIRLVCVNAGIMLVAAGASRCLKDACAQAAASVRSGQAEALLEEHLRTGVCR